MKETYVLSIRGIVPYSLTVSGLIENQRERYGISYGKKEELHVSIASVPIHSRIDYEHFLKEVVLTIKPIFFKQIPCAFGMIEFKKRPKGYFFGSFPVEPTNVLSMLHAGVQMAFGSFYKGSPTEKDEEYALAGNIYDEEEIKLMKEHGNPRSFQRYRPHVTFGIVNDKVAGLLGKTLEDSCSFFVNWSAKDVCGKQFDLNLFEIRIDKYDENGGVLVAKQMINIVQ